MSRSPAALPCGTLSDMTYIIYALGSANENSSGETLYSYCVSVVEKTPDCMAPLLQSRGRKRTAPSGEADADSSRRSRARRKLRPRPKSLPFSSNDATPEKGKNSSNRGLGEAGSEAIEGKDENVSVQSRDMTRSSRRVIHPLAQEENESRLTTTQASMTNVVRPQFEGTPNLNPAVRFNA